MTDFEVKQMPNGSFEQVNKTENYSEFLTAKKNLTFNRFYYLLIEYFISVQFHTPLNEAIADPVAVLSKYFNMLTKTDTVSSLSTVSAQSTSANCSNASSNKSNNNKESEESPEQLDPMLVWALYNQLAMLLYIERSLREMIEMQLIDIIELKNEILENEKQKKRNSKKRKLK